MGIRDGAKMGKFCANTFLCFAKQTLVWGTVDIIQCRTKLLEMDGSSGCPAMNAQRMRNIAQRLVDAVCRALGR